MIWESIWIMTVIDVLIVGVAASSGYLVLKFSVKLRRIGALRPATFLIAGFLLTGVFYSIDLFIMHALPRFSSPSEAMSAMENLHLNWQWVVSLATVASIFAGLLGVIRNELALVDRLGRLGRRRAAGLLRQVIDLIPFPIYAKDIDGRFLFANQGVARELNIAVDEVTGRLHRDLASDHRFAEWVARDREVIAKNIALTIPEEKYQDADGTELWRWSLRVPFRAEAGDKPAVLGISMDITQRKRAEQEVQLQAEIAANMSEGVYLIRVSDGIIQYTNPRFEQMFGYAPGR